jgi:hypothetical protein
MLIQLAQSSENFLLTHWPKESSSSEDNQSSSFLLSDDLFNSLLLFALFLFSLFSALLPHILTRNDQFSFKSIILLTLLNNYIGAFLLSAALLILLPYNNLLIQFYNSLMLNSTANPPDAASSSASNALNLLPNLLLLAGVLFPLCFERCILCFVPRSAFSRGELGNFIDSGDSEALQRIPSRKTATKLKKTKQLVGKSSNFTDIAVGEEFESTNTNLSSDTDASPLFTPTLRDYSTFNLALPARSNPLSRCLFCLENINSLRSAAYHSAGCNLANRQANSLGSKANLGLRGRVNYSKRWHALNEVNWLLILLINMIFFGIIVGFTHNSSPYIQNYNNNAVIYTGNYSRTAVEAAQLGTLLGFAFIFNFTLGLACKLARLSYFFSGILIILADLIYCSCAVLFSTVFLPSLAPESYFLAQICCNSMGIGLILYYSTVEILLEELNRAENYWLKGLAVAAGIGSTVALALLL